MVSSPHYVSFNAESRSAGGGGSKSKDRKSKLRIKNEKLRQERKRKVRATARAKSTDKEGVKRTADQADVPEHVDVHPSRRKQVSG